MHMLRKEKGGDPEKVLFAIGVAVLGAHPLTEMLCYVLLMVYPIRYASLNADASRTPLSLTSF